MLLYTSGGFHTFEMSESTNVDIIEKVLKDFKKYKKATGEIRIRPDKMKNKYDPYGLNWIIEYIGKSERKGLTWKIRHPKSIEGYIEYMISRYGEYENDKCCSIKAEINPKTFAGIKDYLTASNSDCLGELAKLFNLESKRISRNLGGFGDYSLIRNDYCVNIDVRELKFPHSVKHDYIAEYIMELIKRADIPRITKSSRNMTRFPIE